MADAVLVDRHCITLLHNPADQRENVNDKESGREDEIDNLLADIEDHQHRHKEYERHDGNDRTTLEVGR
jgi:hypothetical protein